MRSRVILGTLTTLLLLLVWIVAVHAPWFLRWISAQWPWLLPLGAVWLFLVWGLLNPLWGTIHFVILLATAANYALTLRAPGLLTSWALISIAVVAVAAYRHNSSRARERAAETSFETSQEEVNALQDASGRLDATTRALSARLQRYVTLREVTEALSRHPEDLEALLATIPAQMLRVLDHAQVSLVYLVELPRHVLALRAAQRRGGEPLVVKQKAGDLFDEWVLRQGQPLLVRDAAKDFRFPQEPPERRERTVGALVAAPLISAQRVLGVLRAEHEQAGAFSPEDLRLLDIVADLAVMAIENTRLYVRTAELAITDDLTGLAVHRYFYERFEEELARARRHNDPVAVLLIDLDHFKQYNDAYGHPAGDKLLRTIAQSLRRLQQGPGDLIARYGGEEFAVLLYGAGRDAAARQAEMLRAAVAAQPIVLRQGTANVTVSIGVATFPDDGMHKESVLQVADQRLYKAKQGGRNQVCAA